MIKLASALRTEFVVRTKIRFIESGHQGVDKPIHVVPTRRSCVVLCSKYLRIIFTPMITDIITYARLKLLVIFQLAQIAFYITKGLFPIKN
ncbi:MAG: hypothetical protein ACFFDK_07590 [Promethearchaeota archaeon]